VRLVRIPADVDREDALLAGLSARQLAILGVAAVALWSLYAATRTVLPLPAFVALATPPALTAIALAVGRLDGMSADRLARAALRQWRSPHRLVPAPDGVTTVPSWVGLTPREYPAPLRVPVERVSPDGVVDLGADGVAMICRAPSLTVGLRTEAEQEAMIAALGRTVNGLGIGMQVVVRSDIADLTDDARELERRAGSLPHPALERAAREHASYLRDISGRDVFRRSVFVVVREAAGADAGGRIRRRADEVRSALAATGISLSLLDGAAVVGALADRWARGARLIEDLA